MAVGHMRSRPGGFFRFAATPPFAFPLELSLALAILTEGGEDPQRRAGGERRKDNTDTVVHKSSLSSRRL